ncbi:hypothetical protein ACT3N8_13705 [Psychrobacter aquimaris]|uniref:hypothetical protein n=1 Tax=Psychrobacter aquimaris TaxID=292733 RepID=UPI003FD65CC3
MIAHNDDAVSATMHFNDYKCIPNATIFLSFPDGKTTDSVELTKDQITHLLSLDCPDAFIAYSLTLCPLSPESSNHTNRRLGCTDKELMGGILIRHSLLNETVPVRSYPKSDYLRHESYPVNNSQLPTNLE